MNTNTNRPTNQELLDAIAEVRATDKEMLDTIDNIRATMKLRRRVRTGAKIASAVVYMFAIAGAVAIAHVIGNIL